MAVTIATNGDSQDATTLPPAHTFDILPALHELLSRIEHTSPGLMAPDPEQLPVDASHYADLAPLEPKDLPTEVLAIKARIRRALRELEKLPDMQRGVTEQQREIEVLEARVHAQRAMIRHLGDLAADMRQT